MVTFHNCEKVAREAAVYSLDALVADFGGTLFMFVFVFIFLFLFSSLSLFLFFRHPQPLPRLQLHDTLASLAGNISKAPNPFQEDLSQECLTGTRLIQKLLEKLRRNAPTKENLVEPYLSINQNKSALISINHHQSASIRSNQRQSASIRIN